MSGPAVVVDGVAKRYGKVHAVERFDLVLERGAVCGLVGPNGAGKTTTIGMLLGLVRPTTGRLRVLGLDPTVDSFRLRHHIGYVPERHFIYDWMKGSQVLALTASVYPTWDRREAKRIVELLGLPTSRQVKQMSKGELAKLALVIALSHAAELIILDEPTSGLDPVVRRELLRALTDILRTRGDCTVLMSSHILSDIERIADRAVIMNGGRIVADDTIDALRARYVRASLLFTTPPAEALVVPGAIRVERSVREVVATFPAMPEQRVREIAHDLGATDCMIQPTSLDDVFVELVAPSAASTVAEVA